MFKRIALLMAMLMIFMSFATGCGNKTETATEGNTADTGSETTAEADAPKGEPTELTMGFITFGQTPADIQLVQDEINKIALEKINAKVTLLPIGIGAYADQVNLMLTSGEKLDLLSVLYIFFPGFVAKGQLLPMDDLLDQYGQGIKDSLGPVYIKSGIVGDSTYAVTTNRDLAGGTGLVMKKELVDKYGIDVSKIKTFDDMEAVFATIKENEPDVVPLVPSTVGLGVMDRYNTYDVLTDGFGVLMNYGQDEKLNVVNYAETDEFKLLTETARSWFEKGYILKDAATTQEAGPTLVKSGRAFSYISPSKPGLAEQESRMAGTEMVVAQIQPDRASTTTTQTFQWTIPSTCENPEVAMQFLNLMYTDKDIVNLLSWGIEGKHYVVKEGEVIDYAEGVDASNTGWGLNTAWQFGNEFIGHVWASDDPEIWNKTKAFNDGAIKSNAIGFTPIAENYKNELAACTNVRNQYYIALLSGIVDPTTVLPEFIKALKDAGIDTIVAEKQKQLDEWLATQQQ